MTYFDSASGITVSRKRADREVRKHGIVALDCDVCDGSGLESTHYDALPGMLCGRCEGTGQGGEWGEWANAQSWPIPATAVLDWLGY